MTFKDKFTDRYNPFNLNKKKMTEMVEAWGWTHFSGVYLTVFLLFLTVLRCCSWFKSTFVIYGSVVLLVRDARRSNMFLNLSERHCIISCDSLLPRHCKSDRSWWKFACMLFRRGVEEEEEAASFS